MVKILGGILLVIVGLVVAINVAGNVVLSKALEAALGVPVSVSRVQFDPFSQKAGIFGLKVQNPAGFTEKNLADIPEVSLQMDLSKIFSQVIRIKEIRLNLDEITVERSKAGKFNLTELQVMKSRPQQPSKPSGDAGKPGEAKPASGPGMKLLIDEVHLSLGRARYVDSGLAQPMTKQIPLEIRDEVFRDVTDPAEIARQIVLKTMQKVGLNALMPDVGQLSAALQGEAGAKLGQFAESMKLPFGKSAN